MKTILIKLIISLVIVIFVPLPSFLNTCDPNIINYRYDPYNDCTVMLIPKPQGVSFLFNAPVLRSILVNQENDLGPNTTWVNYGINSLIWLTIIFILLSIMEFAWKRFRKTSISK